MRACTPLPVQMSRTDPTLFRGAPETSAKESSERYMTGSRSAEEKVCSKSVATSRSSSHGQIETFETTKKAPQHMLLASTAAAAASGSTRRHESPSSAWTTRKRRSSCRHSGPRSWQSRASGRTLCNKNMRTRSTRSTGTSSLFSFGFMGFFSSTLSSRACSKGSARLSRKMSWDKLWALVAAMIMFVVYLLRRSTLLKWLSSVSARLPSPRSCPSIMAG
mmetsp:Transcript_72517/g.222051  ORF Transcript_72517/g.222051 Transcript_72517/m.222051 type:complete len:220 (+) Transcript_72517:665-1324(+)